MKRLLTILLFLLLLIACVPTPDQEAVVNKSDLVSASGKVKAG